MRKEAIDGLEQIGKSFFNLSIIHARSGYDCCPARLGILKWRRLDISVWSYIFRPRSLRVLAPGGLMDKTSPCKHCEERETCREGIWNGDELECVKDLDKFPRHRAPDWLVVARREEREAKHLEDARKRWPDRLCECGCGQPTRRAKRTDAAHDDVKGRPSRFLPHHSRRIRHE